MSIEMLVVDLDGTLLSSRSRVSDANRDAIDRARDLGIEVIIASGRTLSECMPAIEAIDHRGTVIAASGSLLCEAESGRTIDRLVIPPEVVGTVSASLVADHRVLVLKDAHAAGYDYTLIGNAPLNGASEWWLETHDIELRCIDRYELDEHPEDTVRVGVVATGSVIEPAATRLESELDGAAHVQHWAAVTETTATGSATHLLEVFARGVNKWTMLQRLCAQRGIATADVAAVGDGLNDVELVSNVGVGVAMGNADARVKRGARHVVGHHDADGFADAVRWVLGDGAPIRG